MGMLMMERQQGDIPLSKGPWPGWYIGKLERVNDRLWHFSVEHREHQVQLDGWARRYEDVESNAYTLVRRWVASSHRRGR